MILKRVEYTVHVSNSLRTFPTGHLSPGWGGGDTEKWRWEIGGQHGDVGDWKMVSEMREVGGFTL